ncbi:hypothetical protein [Sedimenticola sp.]|uniref:hypothetical protein n=1 Tax=Sedimenticola sp. TaxID=1940285 RepID=UPI003D0E87D2
MEQENVIRLPPLLILLLLTTLAGFVFGLLLPHWLALRPAAPLHLIFALGIMPLILGAMTYFVPVLTRTRAPEPLSLIPALLALAAGILLSISLFFSFALYPFAAVIGLTAALWLSIWIQRRKKQTLGRPHPGLIWYQLALASLLLGLIAILAGTLFPDYWTQLRRLHLHLNLLGFVGLTALGTLRVLLPTGGGYGDPEAGPWLMRQWRWMTSGALFMALGAAVSPILSLLGMVLWLPPLAQLLKSLFITHRQHIWQQHGATTPLACAVLGLTILLLSGAVHAFGWHAATYTTQAFIPLFLLPLVSGAATHLLPLWVTAARHSNHEQALRQRLGRHGGGRAALFLLGGLLILAGQDWGVVPILLALLHFIIAALRCLFLKS